jgi:hypothetical protein
MTDSLVLSREYKTKMTKISNLCAEINKKDKCSKQKKTIGWSQINFSTKTPRQEYKMKWTGKTNTAESIESWMKRNKIILSI